jgi:mannose-6-phosphate isomerase-like protein (cupin superfamily)
MPHSGGGNHFHHQDEEMYLILDGEAEFTVDGHTSLLQGPAGALAQMGHSHGIYNPTDKPVQWMNISVSAIRGKSSAFDLNDTLEHVKTIDAIPQFMNIHLDQSLLRPVEHMNGGEGTVRYRRVLEPYVITTSWAYIDHLTIPSGSSVGRHFHREVAEVFYVLGGEGTITVSGDNEPAESSPI